MNNNISLEELAQKLDSFYYNFDTYSYNDSFDSREKGFQASYNLLVNKSYQHILVELSDIISDEEGTEEDIKAAKELLELLQSID